MKDKIETDKIWIDVETLAMLQDIFLKHHIYNHQLQQTQHLYTY